MPWHAVGNNFTATSNGTAHMSDNSGGTLPQAFYRVVVVD